jgi:MFS family permease
MTDGARAVRRIYLSLTLLSTLGSSLIWGINTLFLLDAGLSIGQAFTANAFFAVGQVLFEVPTGVVADTWGRRTSYLWGSATLLASTLLYLLMWELRAPLWGWAISSMVIGLGFTFFSGAVEAWLVDALAANGYEGEMDGVFARGQVVGGVSMLAGAVIGGFVAQATNLAVPYLARAGLLLVTFVVAWLVMRDEGFTPAGSEGPVAAMRRLVSASVEHGWRIRPLRWVMLASPFTAGVGVYAFYAMQPYLLELYGDRTAFGVAGLAAAILAASQIVGGLTVGLVRRLFRSRTTVMLVAATISSLVLVAVGWSESFWVAIVGLVVWGLVFSAAGPVRQAYVNGLVPSAERATILSFDSLLGSSGGVVTQPVLGRVADIWSYGASYAVSGVVQAVAVPLIAASRSHHAACDEIGLRTPEPERPPPIECDPTGPFTAVHSD